MSAGIGCKHTPARGDALIEDPTQRCYVGASPRHTRDRGIPTENMSAVLLLFGLTTVTRCSVKVQHTGKSMGELSADISHRTAAAGRGRTPQV